MKTMVFYFTFLLSCITVMAQVYPSYNIQFKSRWDDSTVQAEPVYSIRYSGCWGYHDSVKNKYYGIIGSTKGTYIIDITDPLNPKQCDFIAGRRDQCIWRELKTYKNYLFMVSDDSPPNSLQIADLSYLPDSVKVVYDSDALFSRSHTIYIEGDKLFCGLARGGAVGYAPMAVYGLQDPVNPVLLRNLNEDYAGLLSSNHVHDMYVRHDSVYASCGTSGLYIFKYQTNNTFVLQSSFTNYSQQTDGIIQNLYNHSSALTGNGKNLVFTDEVPSGLKIKMMDVSDISNPVFVTSFTSTNGATPHNPFIKGNLLYVASYQDGLQVWDISNPSNPLKKGFFDTFPDNVDTFLVDAYQGCWGAYPFFNNGIVICSDMQRGLFVLDSKNLVSVNDNQKINSKKEFNVYPTVFSDWFKIIYHSDQNKNSNLKILDLYGKVVYNENIKLSNGINYITINDLKNLKSGSYLISIKNDQIYHSKLIIKM